MSTPVRWDAEHMDAVLAVVGVPMPLADRIVAHYEQSRLRGPDKPCEAIVHHGPGSQSTETCEVLGPHTEHYARLPSGGDVAWTDDDPYARNY